MILKMNFNFNFKDMPRRLKPSIWSLTNRCDGNHTAQFRHWTVCDGSEGDWPTCQRCAPTKKGERWDPQVDCRAESVSAGKAAVLNSTNSITVRAFCFSPRSLRTFSASSAI